MVLLLVFNSNVRTYRNNGHFYDIPDACMATDNTNLPIVIKTFLGMDMRGHSLFHKNLLLFIFLGSLISFISQNDQGESITCYAYEKYTPLRK